MKNFDRQFRHSMAFTGSGQPSISAPGVVSTQKKAPNKKKTWTLGLVAVMMTVFLAGCSGDSSSAASSSIAPVADSVTAEAVAPPHDIDFAQLQGMNPDIIAWIEVPGTVIDYPVLYGVDNEFYLTKDENKEYDVGGSIFTDMSNSSDFSDPVTVTYGHYMPDESLYTQLHNYRDADFFAENRDVFVYLPEKTLQYEVVGAFNIGEENILYNNDYSQPHEMQGFVDWVTFPRDMEANVNMEGATKDDQYLVMSTCQSVEDSSSRYIVVAKLVEG